MKETMNEEGQITEQLQVVTHSRGSAYGAGYMEGMRDEIKKLAEAEGIGFAYDENSIVEYSVNLAPHQSNWIDYEESGSKNEFVENDKYKAYANQWATDPSAATGYAALQKNGINFAGGSGGTIFWNPNGGTSVWEVGGKQANRPFVFLSHEMFHGLDANRGLLDSRPHLGIARSEWQAVYRENMLRQQMGLPLRTYYKSQLNSNTGVEKPLPPYLLTPSATPLLPSWYKP
jgi:hypothetical protein